MKHKEKNYIIKALELNPDQAELWYVMAYQHALQKDVDHAIEYLRKAIHLDPKNRNLAQTDTGFDGIREDLLFQALFHEDHRLDEE